MASAKYSWEGGVGRESVMGFKSNKCVIFDSQAEFFKALDRVEW